MVFSTQDIVNAYQQTVGAGTMSEEDFVNAAMNQYGVSADQLMAAQSALLGTAAPAETTVQGALAAAFPSYDAGANVGAASDVITGAAQPAATVGDDVVRSRINEILSNPDMTYEQQAALISSAARINNLTNADLSRITGFSLDQVNTFLGANEAGVNTVSPFTAAATSGGQLGGIILAGDSFLSGSENIRNIASQTGQNVSSVAVGGSTTSDTLDQLNQFLSRGGTFAPGATVVLNLGGNDLMMGVDDAVIARNINDIVSTLGQRGVNVVLSGAPDIDSLEDITGSTSLRLNPIYEEIQRNNPNVTLVDAMSGLLSQKNVVDETGFHLTDPGQIAFNAALSNAVLKSQGREGLTFTDADIREAIRQSGLSVDEATRLAPYFGLTSDRIRSAMSGEELVPVVDQTAVTGTGGATTGALIGGAATDTKGGLPVTTNSASQQAAESAQVGALQKATQGTTVSDANIKTYVTNVLSSDLTDAEKARNISDAARANNVSEEDLARATGFTVDQVRSYLGQSTVNPAANNDTANAVVATNSYFNSNPDVASEYARLGLQETLSPEEFASQHWQNHGRYEGRTGPNGEAPNAADKMYDHRGTEYDRDTVLKLAGQIIPNLGSLSGGAFGTKGESIGFNYQEAKRILGKDPSAAEQVVLDMARNLMDRGITDLGQLQVKDVYSNFNARQVVDDYGNATGQYVVDIVDPNNPEYVTQRILTKEESDKLTSELITDPEGAQYTRYVANNILSGKALHLGDNVLAQAQTGAHQLAISLGGTYTGPGATDYRLVFNPTTGKLQFETSGRSTSSLAAIQPLLMVASFIPGVAPFAQLVNAAIAIHQGNPLAAVASLAGMGGYTNVATALNVANAIDKKDPTALIGALMSNPTVADAAGTTMLTDTISLADAATAINIVTAAEKGDFAAVLSGAGKLTGSQDLQTAGAAATLIKAAADGNVGAMINGVQMLNNTVSASNNLGNKDVADTLINNVTNDLLSSSGAKDLGEATYIAATNAGATDDEALNASNVVSNINAASGNDNATTQVTGDVKSDIMNGVTTIDTEFGDLDKAISDATKRNTLTIGNADANSLEEAAAMAGARGFSNFTYGGKTYAMSATSQEVAAQATAADIAAAKNFNDAYGIARKSLGPGQVFEWNGKKYSTDTREENPSLAAASDQIRYAEMGAGAGRGSYAGYDAKAAADAYAKLNPSVVNSATALTTAPTTLGTMDDFLLLGGMSGDYVVVGDGISKELFDPVVKTIGTVVRAGGSFLDNMAGGLQAVNVIDKNSGIVRIANDMQKWGSDRMGDYLIGAEKNVMDRVSKVEGWDNKFIELGKALYDNPSAILTLGANEVFEEGVPLLTGVGAAKIGGKLLALGADAFMNAWEAGGANYNDTRKAAINAGMSESDAHTAAQKSAGGAAAVASVLGPVADMPWIKRAGSTGTSAAESSTKVVGKATAKETITEYPEEFAASAMSDFFATGAVDLNKAFTQATVGSVVAGKAVGTITVVSEVSRSGDATTEIINSSTTSPEQSQTLINTINQSMQPGVDLKAVGADIVTAMEASGMNTAQAQNVANTAVAEQVVNNLPGLSINNLNIAVGTDQSGNPVTLGDFIGSSVTGTGGRMYVAPDIFIGTNAEGKPVTVGDLSNLSSLATTKTTESTSGSNSETVSSSGVTVSNTNNLATGDQTTIASDAGAGTNTTATVNQNTGIDSTSTTDTKTGTEVTTTVDNNTGTTTQAATDANTGVTTTTQTNPNTGATTETVVNSNTGITTTTQSDANTKTETVVDSNSGVTTQTQTNTATNTTTNTVVDTTTGVNTQIATTTNSTTETTTDTNTNVTTQVKTDTTANTETTTQTNANTGVTTQTTVNNNTGTTTTVTTNSNGQVTTQTTVDTNTNTETTVLTDVNTNTSTTVVVDMNTNTIVSTTTDENVVIETLDPLNPVDITETTDDGVDASTEDKTKTKTPPKAAPKAGAPSLFAGMAAGAPYRFGDPTLLRSYVTGEKKLDPLERVREIQEEMEQEAMIQNIDPRLASILKDRMGAKEDLSGLDTLARVLGGQGFDPEKAAEAEKEGAYYSYGKEDSIDDILSGSLGGPREYAEGGYVEPLMAEGGMTLPLLAKKGGLPKMAGGREDFRDGKHVAGDGDGQSDDIPAMLADGEFVFPADVVSALGNGSTKAGTDKLYEMMHQIRKRARSTGKKDLPPPALKSPLDYLKSKR